MTAGLRVGAFGALLAAVFALAALAGRAAGPVTQSEPGHGSMTAASSQHGDSHETSAGAGGFVLRPSTTMLTAGRPQRLRFAIEDEHGAIVRDFEVEQARRMHLIVVRRDLRRFQHLHPTQETGGRWSVTVKLPDAGVYHAFADFQTGGARHAVGADLFAAGRFEPLALPEPATTATTDGYDVALHAASDGTLRFGISRDGGAVVPQPYLGAQGHLVMLRAGDLDYQHVHPLADEQLAFDTSAAKPGTYRLFLQFRHGDRVHTVAYTYEVAP
jgi:hypothetical protein